MTKKNKCTHFLLWGAMPGMFLIILSASLLFFDGSRSMIELVYERPRIERALNSYFAAERSRDYTRLYKCLAPSSHYRKTHSFQDFLSDMKSNDIEILGYKVVDIYGLRPNHDPSTYPNVERFVQTEVDVEILFKDTKRKASYNYCFTFLKEDGAWFKG